MQYMLLIYDDESTWATMPEKERNHWYGEYTAFTNELRENGAFVAADQLQSSASATTVTVRDGEKLTTDGPFAETKEALGGYYLIDVASDDEAIAWAAKIPSAQFGRVEVRPVVQIPAETQA
ncbi:MAG: YciI family protein [Actinobacteria bacterium]|nr:MAG: YciI family protein [Actinomycetota bacterium]